MLDAVAQHELQVGHVMDFMATCIEVGNGSYPEKFKGNSITPLQGISLVPAFKGKEISKRIIYNEHSGGRSVMDGDWKLVKFSGAKPWHLYNMKTDGTELNDMTLEKPLKGKELKNLWNTWATENNVLPKPGK